jgi:type 1 glutamine amidotransferase
MRKGLVIAMALAACCLWAGENAKPLKVLYVTGGGYHDYKKNSPFQAQKINELVNASVDVKFGLEQMGDAKFGEGYDVIVYDICFDKRGGLDKTKDVPLVENGLKVTREGKPTVFLHCSMHSFMPSDDWTNCCGMRTRVHDPFGAFSTIKATPDHPIVKTFPDDWKTPGDELYQTIKFPETSTPLLKVTSPHNKKESVVAWCTTYGKGKVFSTTLGHDMKTLASPDYLKLLGNGVLWAADKLDKDGKPAEGYAGPGPK